MTKTINDLSPSYMQLGLHRDGDKPIWLRVPTFWDAPKQMWIGAIQTPETFTLITATGTNSQELEQNFNIKISEAFATPDLAEEVFNMFKEE